MNSKFHDTNQNITRENPLMQQRVHWVDYAKGIGIFLVVVGHTCGGLVDSSILLSSPAARFPSQWIYAFHMPLFYFLSGLFIRGSASKPLKDFVVDKLQVIAYPYFVWSIIQIVLMVIASRYVNSSMSLTDILQLIYKPVLVFSFLYTLFIIMLVYGVAHKLKLSPSDFFGFSILLYCFHLLGMSVEAWKVWDLVCQNIIYFALGAFLDSKKLLTGLSQVKTPLLISVSIGGFLLVALAVLLNIVENQSAVPLIAMIGISASVALAILLERFNLTAFIEVWGLLSLQIYVVHTIVTSGVRMVLQKIFGFSEPFTHIMLGTIAGIYAPIALDQLCNKLRFRYMFTLRPRRY